MRPWVIVSLLTEEKGKGGEGKGGTLGRFPLPVNNRRKREGGDGWLARKRKGGEKGKGRPRQGTLGSLGKEKGGRERGGGGGGKKTLNFNLILGSSEIRKKGGKRKRGGKGEEKILRASL